MISVSQGMCQLSSLARASLWATMSQSMMRRLGCQYVWPKAALIRYLASLMPSINDCL